MNIYPPYNNPRSMADELGEIGAILFNFLAPMGLIAYVILREFDIYAPFSIAFIVLIIWSAIMILLYKEFKKIYKGEKK